MTNNKLSDNIVREFDVKLSDNERAINSDPQKEDTDKIELLIQDFADLLLDFFKFANDGKFQIGELFELISSLRKKGKRTFENKEEIRNEIKDLSLEEIKHVHQKMGELFFLTMAEIKALKAPKKH